MGFIRETGTVVDFFPCVTFSKSIYYKLQTYNFNKFTALVNFNKTEQSTALTTIRHFHSHNYCSLDILSFMTILWVL